MADQATEHTTIDASPEACFATVGDIARYPEWVGDVKQAEIVARDDLGRPQMVTFRTAAMGRSTTYTLRYRYGAEPLSVGWELVEGDIMRVLDGEYQFRPSATSPGGTDVTYQLAIDLVVPLPGFVKRRAESRILKSALPALKSRVEGGADS